MGFQILRFSTEYVKSGLAVQQVEAIVGAIMNAVANRKHFSVARDKMLGLVRLTTKYQFRSCIIGA